MLKVEDWKSRLEKISFPLLLLAGMVFASINTAFTPHGISLVLLLGLLLIPFGIRSDRSIAAAALYLLILFFAEKAIYQPDLWYFFRSSLLFLGFASLFYFSRQVLQSESRFHYFLKWMSAIHSVFILMYLLLWLSPWKDLVWWTFFLSPSVGDFTRLKGLGYEPSYFALMLAPFFLYQLSRLLKGHFQWQTLLPAGILGAGLLASFSMGVLGSLVLSLGIALFRFRNSGIFRIRLPLGRPVLLAMLAGSGLLAYLLFPEAAIFLRLKDIFSGRDLSANNRLLESFLLAKDILGTDRLWLGLGPGQLKLEGFYFIKSFYNYQWNDSWAPSMPNSVSDWLCNFGLAGLAIKFFLIGRYFVRTKTSADFFRFLCFIFIFIYQFTGGFLFCLPELMLWVLAFSGNEVTRIQHKAASES